MPAFGKAVIAFLLISLFAIVMVGATSMMIKDKPTDSYYSDPNNTATGSSGLVTTVFGSGSSMAIPIVGIAGILVLFAGFMMLKKH
jgi:hypothetical protein